MGNLTLTGYLTIVGFVPAQGPAVLRLGYLTDMDDPTHEQRLSAPENESITVNQLDASGTQLSQYLIPGEPAHHDPVGEESLLFAGKLPLDAATVELVLLRQGSAIAKFVIPPNPPSGKLTWQAGNQVTGQQTVTWEATHPDGAPLEYMVLYSHDGGQTFKPLSQSLTTTSYTLDFDQLPGGTAQVGVLVTDGAHTIRLQSPSFAAPIKPVYTMILSPANGASVNGRWVTLRGQGYYLEEHMPELKALAWTSSLDGQLGTGPMVQTKMSKGQHTLTLRAGTGSRQGTASISLNVTLT